MPERIFTAEDRLKFAELSGDSNPLHVDGLYARRSMFGGSVAHGAHALLWALDFSLKSSGIPARLKSLKASFPSPIRAGEKAVLSQSGAAGREEALEIRCGDTLAASIEAVWAAPLPGLSAVPDSTPRSCAPRRLTLSEIRSASGEMELMFSRQDAGELFPTLSSFLPADQLAFLLATTRLIGMECPGLNSLYSELDLATPWSLPGPSGLAYRTLELDDRFGLATIRAEGPTLAGNLRAFVRPESPAQPAYSEIRKMVAPGEFSGQRALVVGGSRGLGETAAKLLAAGGAKVRATYNRGREDALRVAGEITAGGGVSAAFQLDVLQPGPGMERVLAGGWAPTHLYYFATPFIFSAKKDSFSEELLDNFRAYYVRAFLGLTERLLPSGLKYVFYPSSAALNASPPGLAEYAAAKSEGEKACERLRADNPGLMVVCPRLPRLATDQTVSLYPVENLAPAPVLLELFRSNSAL